MKRFSNLKLIKLLFVISASVVFTLFIRDISETSAQENNTFAVETDRINSIVNSSVFIEFDNRVEQYLDGTNGTDNDYRRSTENLAIRRKTLLKELIQIDPKSAIGKAISAKDYSRLPDFITKHSEKIVSGYGDFNVFVSDEIEPITGKLRDFQTEREVVFGDFRYKAYVFGRREDMTTKLDIPLQGIVLDGLMAVDENPLRKIEETEYELLGIDLFRLGEYGVAAEVGGEIIYFSNQTELDNFVRRQIEWESKIGPVRPLKDLAPEESASPWTEGLKTVLLIRVDFSDRPGEPLDANNQPLTQIRAQNLITNEVSPFYVSSSYNKTSQQVTVTPVVRLPQPLTYYEQGTNYGIMLTDARNAARAVGFETNNFDLDIVAFSYSQNMNWAGRGFLGGKGTWLNGYFDLRVTAHELGHNYGLHHANLWRTTDGTVIGAGNDVEYGDSFDMMGFGGDSRFHFNVRYKRSLDWITDANIQTVTSDGIYRIYMQDSPLPGNMRGLKIRKNSEKNYWIEFRQLFTNNSSVMNGALIRWDYLSGGLRRTQLLDMTPATPQNFDQPLLIGQSFLDNDNRIRMTVLGKGNTTPESLDVRVELNVGCSFSLGQASQNFSASGGEGSITVNTQSGCRPPATTNDNWLFAESTDTGSVRYIVAANYNAQSRIGTISIAGQIFTIQQAGAITPCAAPPSGLVAWWRGEGNALDQTGVNNGTIINNLTFGGGKIGGGFLGNYTGNAGTVEVPDSASLALTRSMTFEGWLKVDSYGGTVIDRRTTNFPSMGSYEVWILSSGRLLFTIWYNNNQGVGVSSLDPMPLGQFVHFAASLDDATGLIKMYINGNLNQQFTITQRPNNISGAKVKIGNVNGITDELSVYNRALSASEIQAVYNAGNAVTGSAGKCLLTNNKTPFDYDGDGKTDVSIFRPSNGQWWINRSSTGQTVAAQFGAGSDKMTPGDFTGDGKTDIAFWRSSTGQWFVLRSDDASFYAFPFGASGDVPVPADYDGDGKTDPAVFRSSSATWYILRSGDGGVTIQQFGASGDKPVAADYDGDGKADIAIIRGGAGGMEWWYQRSSNGQVAALQFGESSDKAVPGDYTGDGRADVAFWRPSNGFWYILRSENFSFYAFPFGSSSDIPSPGDYDGDGKFDAAVFRPASSTWYISRSTAGIFIQDFGAAGDIPIPSAFVP